MKLALLFDMDGVLADSLDLNKECWLRTFKQYGVKDFGTPGRGSTWEELCKYTESLNSGIKIPVRESSEKCSEYQYVMLQEKGNREGIVAFLESMSEKDIPMIVCTNSGVVRAEKFLEILGIKGYFKKIIAKEHVTKYKPDPEMYLLGAEELNVKPEECIVFEDSEAGLLAGKAANMKVVGFHNPGQDIYHFKQADLVIESFEEINYETLKELIER